MLWNIFNRLDAKGNTNAYGIGGDSQACAKDIWTLNIYEKQQWDDASLYANKTWNLIQIRKVYSL